MLSTQHLQEKKENRQCILKILANLKFLAQQGLALRGDDDTESNFMQLLKLSATNDQVLAKWFKKKINKYVSHSVQNKLLQVTALTVLLEISYSILKSTFYSIMCDEFTNTSNKEQLVICIRWIADDLVVHLVCSS